MFPFENSSFESPEADLRFPIISSGLNTKMMIIKAANSNVVIPSMLGISKRPKNQSPSEIGAPQSRTNDDQENCNSPDPTGIGVGRKLGRAIVPLVMSGRFSTIVMMMKLRPRVAKIN